MSAIDDPSAWLLQGRPDLGRLRAQTERLVHAYRDSGVAVDLLDAPDAPPNILFLRDTFFMTPSGAILARPRHEVRRAEIPFVRAFLASYHIPVLGEVAAPACFEGADALWLRFDRVVIGVGGRTDKLGASQVAEMLGSIGVDSVAVPAPPRSQHLLGALNFLSSGHAALRRPCSDRVHVLLAETGVAALAFEETPDVVERRCLNFVALGNGSILAPDMTKESRASLTRAGAKVRTVPIDQYLVCAGGVGCATGILHREKVASSPDVLLGLTP